MAVKKMPLRVGIDLASVEAVRESVRAHGARYLKRVYTDRELRDCRTPEGVDAERLAARFAAKEAAIKVLRPAADYAVPWSSVGVTRGRGGAPEVELTGPAASLAAAAGIDRIELSLTHEAELAAAVAIAGVSDLEQADG